MIANESWDETSKDVLPSSRYLRNQFQGALVTALRGILTLLFCFSLSAFGQTAEELVAKNLQAKGGLDKIKAIKSVRMSGHIEVGGFKAAVGQESKRPDMLRQTFTVQGMTQIQSYDGSTGWQISPFEGRKDPQLLGEE